MTTRSVVQRQLWLMHNGSSHAAATGMSRAQAYDAARKEFYAIRHADEVARRVAREEALSTGAQFGMSALQVGMQLEAAEFERWRGWARQQVTLQEQARTAAYSGGTAVQGEGEEGLSGRAASGMEAVLDELKASVKGGRKGTEVRGGAVVHP